MIKFLRAVVRPYLALLFGTVIAGLGVYLILTYGSETVMERYADWMLSTGSILIGFYFAARMIKK